MLNSENEIHRLAAANKCFNCASLHRLTFETLSNLTRLDSSLTVEGESGSFIFNSAFPDVPMVSNSLNNLKRNSTS